MKEKLFIILCFIAFCNLFSVEAENKKVVFIIIDGVPTDILQKVYTPNIDRIAKEGVFVDSYVGGLKNKYAETPTISSPGYACLLTGTWGNKNNVWNNEIKNPNYHYPTIFRMYKDAYPNGEIAIYSTWEDNRTKLCGENKLQTQGLTFDYRFDGLENDTIQYPHDNESIYIKLIDGEVATEAAKGLYKYAPDLTWVYLQYTDDAGHRYGESSRLYNAVAYEDALIGLIYDAVKQREIETEENWLFIVTTDHGRSPLTALHHGGQSERAKYMDCNE